MGGWIIWVVLAGALVAGEAVTGRRRLGPLAVAAGLAAIVAAAAGAILSVLAFAAAVALVLRATARPAAARGGRRASVPRARPPRPGRQPGRRARQRARREAVARLREGASALVGRDAVVLERIVNRDGVGIVDVDGHVFSARALHEEDEIDAGERVEVVDVRGATALVA